MVRMHTRERVVLTREDAVHGRRRMDIRTGSLHLLAKACSAKSAHDCNGYDSSNGQREKGSKERLAMGWWWSGA